MDWGSVYGIGKGGAKIYKGNPALDDLKQTYAQRQQQRAQDDMQFAQNVAKLNMKGARDADMPLLNKQYQDILDTHAKLRQANDLPTRQMLQQQLQQKQQGMLYDISHSSETNDKEKAAMNLRFTHPDDLSDTYHSDMTDLTKTPSIGDNAVKYNDVFNNKSQAWLQKPVDLGKMSDDIVKRITTTSKSSGNTKRNPVTGLYYTPTESTTAIDKGDYLNQVAQAAKSNHAIGRQLMKEYGTNDIADAVQKHVESTYPIYAKNTGIDVIHGGEFQSESQRKEKLPSWLESYNMKVFGNPNPAQASDNQPTPAQILINNMKQGVPGSGEKLLSLVPKGQYGNQKPAIGIDNKTGEQVFSFPAQVDQKAIVENQQKKSDWAKRYPGEPYDPNEKGFALKPEVIKPAKQYKLNPISDTYFADHAQMAKEQNINLPQLNQIEGVKGGHGQIPQINNQTGDHHVTTKYKTSNGKSYTHTELLKAGYTEDQIKQAIKLGNLK